MKLKAGVIIKGIQPELVLGLMIADSIYQKYGHELTVTSVMDSKHGANSLHYKGLAADLRITNVIESKHYPNGLEGLVRELETSLVGFDVVLEKDHIHIEYDPR